MSAKAILVLCAQALLLKSALGQCTSRAAVAAAPGIAAPGLAGSYGYGLAGPAALAYDGLAAAPFGLAGRGLAYDGLATGCGGLGYDGFYGAAGLGYDGFYGAAMEFSPTSGGGLPVSSASAIAPVGLSVVSDNIYEGALALAGELPFVGTVGVEGVLPTAGAGAVNHACGNGRNAMISETTAFGPAAAGYGLGAAGYGLGGAGYGLGAAGYGLGAAGYGLGAAIAPAAGLGYLGGFAGRGCGCGL